MKSIILSAIVLFFISTPLKAQDGYRIEVKIKNLEDSVCYLGYYFGDKRYIKDTVDATSGTMVFQGPEKLTGGIYFIYTPSHYFEIVMDETQHFSIETDTVDFIGKMQVVNSPDNVLFRDLRIFIGARQKKAASLSERLKAAKGTPEEKEITEQLAALEKEVVAYQDELIAKHPESFTALVLKATRRLEIPDPPRDAEGNVTDQEFQFRYYKKHFFDHIDFTDSRFLRTSFFHDKVNEYLEKLTVQHPDSVTAAAKYLIDKTGDNKEMFRYMLVTLAGKYETSEIMGMDKVFVELAEKYYLTGRAEWADTTVINKIRRKVNDIKPNLIGNKAPQLVLYDSLERPVNALSLKSDFTILFFFDPDCGHCKTTAPKLKAIYNDLKAKGAEVIGVSSAPELEGMKKFMKELDLPWLSFADLAGQRKPYNIYSTPVIYILDHEKKIIAKRLDVDQIPGFLDHQIKMRK